MKVYTLKRKQFLAVSIDEAWNYFSSPANLSKITPDKLGFEVITNHSAKMYPGMIIQYFVKPLLNIRIRWVTEITHVNQPYFFVDEQRCGPYKLWHHQHKFTEVEGGVMMEDEVNYSLPFGFLGRIIHSLLVKSDLNYIFEYRKSILKTIFPEKVNFSKGAA